jgi:hypothetical protein
MRCSSAASIGWNEISCFWLLMLGFHPSLWMAVIPAKAEGALQQRMLVTPSSLLHQSKWIPAFAHCCPGKMRLA